METTSVQPNSLDWHVSNWKKKRSRATFGSGESLNFVSLIATVIVDYRHGHDSFLVSPKYVPLLVMFWLVVLLRLLSRGGW